MVGKIWIDNKLLVIDIWVQLRSGASAKSLVKEGGPNLRTIERIRKVAKAIANRESVGDIADIGPWDLKRARNLVSFYAEIPKDCPADQEADQASILRYSDLSSEQLWGIIDPIIESMWIPNADEVPIELFEDGPGFRAADVGRHQFCWTQGVQERVRWDSRTKQQVTKQVLMVEKVWFSEGEEKDLLGALRFIEETRGKPIVNQYEELQESVVVFVKSSVDYKFGRIYNGLDPINKIWAAEQAGEPFNKKDPFIAPGYTLMHEHTRLSGQVVEFKRELRRMVLNWTP